MIPTPNELAKPGDEPGRGLRPAMSRATFVGCDRCGGRGYGMTLLAADSERALTPCPFCGLSLAAQAALGAPPAQTQ